MRHTPGRGGQRGRGAGAGIRGRNEAGRYTGKGVEAVLQPGCPEGPDGVGRG